MFKWFFCRSFKPTPAAQSVYSWALESAQKRFPARFDGISQDKNQRIQKFEAISVYMTMALWFLHQTGDDELAQEAYDTMFADFDGALREQGVSDIRVGPEIRKLSAAFQGRMVHYGEAYTGHDNKMLAAALTRNYCLPEAEADEFSRQILAQLSEWKSKGEASWQRDFMNASQNERGSHEQLSGNL